MERSKIKACVLDASVIIKWFSEENDSNIAISIREKFVEGEIIITVPDLILYEIANALKYNSNFNEYDVKSAIDSLFELGIDILAPTENILKNAVDTAFELNATLYDSYYIALARELNFVFVTADIKFYNKIKDKIDFVILLKNFENENEF